MIVVQLEFVMTGLKKCPCKRKKKNKTQIERRLEQKNAALSVFSFCVWDTIFAYFSFRVPIKTSGKKMEHFLVHT